MLKTAWVTGASSGLGRYTAQALVREGWRVAAGARSFQGQEGEGPEGFRLPLDVTHHASIAAFCQKALAQVGTPGALVNCAGILVIGAAEDCSDQELRQVMDVNFFGMAAMVRAVLPLMRANGSGRIVNYSSVNGLFASPFQGAYSAAKKPLREALEEAQARLSKKLESLRRSLQDDAALEHLRQGGELLLAYQYTLQSGQTVLRAQYEVDGPELAIELDPALTPLENAQSYFERYDKAKRAREGVPQLVEAAEQELDYLRQLETDLELATNWPEIGEVQDALQAGGYWRGRHTTRPGGGKPGPLKVVADDFVIWVGRNSRQNDAVTFDKGGPDDLWLHVRGMPGAHVIIKSAGRDVPPDVIERAAAIAAYYSRARTERRVLVDVTRRKHVRKIKGGKPGMVTYRNESPVEVVPAPE